MKKLSILLAIFCSVFLFQTRVLASDHPEGIITFYNASDNEVTAKVSAVGKFTLAANERKDVSYSTLSYACSDNPTSCRAQFYVNDQPAGSATIDVTAGKVVNMNLSMKVKTQKQENVLRTVVIQ